MASSKRIRGRDSGGRASPGAAAKRRAARRLNDVVEQAQRLSKLDGRTEKRRQRLIGQLTEGRDGERLSAIDAVHSLHELLEMGETLPSLRKQGVRARRVPRRAEVLEAVEEAQAAYGFRDEAWWILGIKR